MKDTLLMSVDLGTSFIKAAVYDTKSNCIAIALEPVKDERPAPGMFIQKGDDLYASAVACMKKVCGEVGSRAQEIEAVAFTGQMSGFMGVDRDWNDITTWSCSLDNRYMPYAERQMKDLKKDFLEISGTNAPQMAPKFEWFKTEFPRENKKIAKYLMISGYIIGKLGDMDIEDAILDTTYTEWTGLADIRKGEWSQRICDAIGLDRKYLPKIVQSNYICGHLSARAAAMIGLTSGIPLVSGAGDKAAGCIGAAVVEPADMIFEASSYGEISFLAEDYRPDMKTGRIDCIPSPIPGYFLATKFVAGSGITIDWYVNTFLRREGEKLSSVFARVEKEMNDIPVGCDGLMAIGLLGGSSMPLDGTLRGMWMGHDWSHKSAHFYRALLESFSYDFELTINKIEELYPEYSPQSVKIVGGGAKSPFWTQMNADVTGKTYQVLDREDVAMWGVAMLAGNAIGVFDDIKETAKKHVGIAKEYVPDPAMREKYRPFKELYEEYVVSLHDFYKKIQETGEQAAGR
ncbi:MAG: FGGY family carbohydrate kinase [Christensenella sp.]|uniref:xylulokinase n=1 Tax=Christensenella sp. TaxID=1935934 RepID=UPI002B1F799C|nr:FGGY family carbohydrate kinase [Christensenella sp.]MEA5004162.1 FGGY family carbohydrate kinase [Christensenella sp.]